MWLNHSRKMVWQQPNSYKLEISLFHGGRYFVLCCYHMWPCDWHSYTPWNSLLARRKGSRLSMRRLVHQWKNPSFFLAGGLSGKTTLSGRLWQDVAINCALTKLRPTWASISLYLFFFLWLSSCLFPAPSKNSSLRLLSLGTRLVPCCWFWYWGVYTYGRLPEPFPKQSLKFPMFFPWEVNEALYCGSVQFSSVAQSCLTLCDPMNCSTPGLPVHHQLAEFTQTHVHRVSDAIQPSHPRLSPSPSALNPS